MVPPPVRWNLCARRPVPEFSQHPSLPPTQQASSTACSRPPAVGGPVGQEGGVNGCLP